jgi:hypothetical protein
MVRHEEQRRSRNAKRLLWAILLAVIAVLAVVAYTSIDAPRPQLQSPEGAVSGAADDGAGRRRQESGLLGSSSS